MKRSNLDRYQACKYILAGILILAVVVLLTACGGKNDSGPLADGGSAMPGQSSNSNQATAPSQSDTQSDQHPAEKPPVAEDPIQVTPPATEANSDFEACWNGADFFDVEAYLKGNADPDTYYYIYSQEDMPWAPAGVPYKYECYVNGWKIRVDFSTGNTSLAGNKVRFTTMGTYGVLNGHNFNAPYDPQKPITINHQDVLGYEPTVYYLQLAVEAAKNCDLNTTTCPYCDMSNTDSNWSENAESPMPHVHKTIN